MSHGGRTQARKEGTTDEMRDGVQIKRKDGKAEGEFQQDDIRNEGTQRGETDGIQESEEGDKESTGRWGGNKGFGKQQLREKEAERKKEAVVDETDLTLNWKGKVFFEVWRSNISLVSAIVQNLPLPIIVKTASPSPLPTSLPAPAINKETSAQIKCTGAAQEHILPLLKY